MDDKPLCRKDDIRNFESNLSSSCSKKSKASLALGLMVVEAAIGRCRSSMRADEEYASVSTDPETPSVERAESFSGGLIIEFSDDTCALYSAELCAGGWIRPKESSWPEDQRTGSRPLFNAGGGLGLVKCCYDSRHAR
jgi:hypothetical protein